MRIKEDFVLASSRGGTVSYKTERRPWAIKIIAIAHNSKAFDIHFILNTAILLKWKLDLIMNGLIIICMRMENLVFLDSVSFLPFPLRRLPEAFGLTVAKSCYPQKINTEKNIDYIRSLPDVSHYLVNEMGEGERSGFLEWCATQERPFGNRRVLEQCFQDYFTVLMEA